MKNILIVLLANLILSNVIASGPLSGKRPLFTASEVEEYPAEENPAMGRRWAVFTDPQVQVLDPVDPRTVQTQKRIAKFE